MSDWRNLVCVTMAILLPGSLFSQNYGLSQSKGAAMLHSSGPVEINGNAAPASAAVFPDDLIQVGKNAEAKIDVSGSTVVLFPNSLVQFEDNEIFLDHGTVQVTSSNEFRVRSGCVVVTPVKAGWTQYQVTNVDQKVKVSAQKDDVNIDHHQSAFEQKPEAAHSDRATVREGEEATRPEKCGAYIRPPSYVDANKAWLSTWQAKGLGIVAAGVIACLGLCHTDDPLSPANPSGGTH